MCFGNMFLFEDHIVKFHFQETKSAFFASIKRSPVYYRMETSKGKPIFEYEGYLYIINKE